MRTPGSSSELEKVRMFAANMFEQKQSCQTIAIALNVNVQTVRRWRRTFVASGRDGLKLHQHPGGTSRLDDTQRARLAELLLLTPRQCGFERHLWTTPLVAELVLKEFGVSYHRDTMGVLLRDLGFSWQKPACRARERDESKVQEWREKVWPEILKKVQKMPA